MELVNAYTVTPDTIKPGDVMCFVVKAMVNWQDDEGKMRYRVYRCPWEGDLEDVPAGSQVFDMEATCREFFPSLAAVGRPG